MIESGVTLSVVLPTRNRRSQVDALLMDFLSVKSKDVELILSDNSDVAIATYPQDARIKVVRPPHLLGMLDNWLFGLSQASGKYVMIIGSDELLVPRDLDALIGDLRKSRAAFISFLPTYLQWSGLRFRRHAVFLGKIPFRMSMRARLASFEDFRASHASGMLMNPYNKGVVRRVHLVRSLSRVKIITTQAPDYLLAALLYITTDCREVVLSEYTPVIIGTSQLSTGLSWDSSVPTRADSHPVSPGVAHDISGLDSHPSHRTLNEELRRAYLDAERALMGGPFSDEKTCQARLELGDFGFPMVWIWRTSDRPEGGSTAIRVFTRLLRYRAMHFNSRGTWRKCHQHCPGDGTVAPDKSCKIGRNHHIRPR